MSIENDEEIRRKLEVAATLLSEFVEAIAALPSAFFDTELHPEPWQTVSDFVRAVGMTWTEGAAEMDPWAPTPEQVREFERRAPEMIALMRAKAQN